MLDFEEIYYKVDELIESRPGLNTWEQRPGLLSFLSGIICEASITHGVQLPLETEEVVDFLELMKNSEGKDLPVNEYYTWWDILPRELTQHKLFNDIEHSIMNFKPGATGPGEVASCLFNKNSLYNSETRPGDISWNDKSCEYKAFYVTGWKNCNNLCTPDKFDQYANKDNIDRLVGVTLHPKKPSVMACADLKNGIWNDVFDLTPMTKTNTGKWTCKSLLGVPSLEYIAGMPVPI